MEWNEPSLFVNRRWPDGEAEEPVQALDSRGLIEAAAIPKRDDSYKKGLADALADQIGTERNDLIEVESFHGDAASVGTKTDEIARLVGLAEGKVGRKTGIAGLDCAREACKNKVRCALCTGRHLTSACNTKYRKKCFRCKGKGAPHTSMDRSCPALIRRVLANPALVISTNSTSN